jgi:hypothetical protein
MRSFGIQGGVIRYWALFALHAVYRSQKNAKAHVGAEQREHSEVGLYKPKRE